MPRKKFKKEFEKGLAILVKHGIITQSFDGLEISITESFLDALKKDADWLSKIEWKDEFELIVDVLLVMAYLRVVKDPPIEEFAFTMPILEAHVGAGFKKYLEEKIMASHVKRVR